MTTIDPCATARAVAADVLANGGSTRSIVPGVSTPAAGYAVSLPGYEEQHKLGDDPVSLQAVCLSYADRHRHILARPNRYLGAWLDGETLYLDVSEVYPEREQALTLARERSQIAVYDLARGESIYTSTGERWAA